MSKVILKGFIVVPSSDLDLVEQELPVHTKLTLEESGCLVFKVEKDKNNPNKFYVYEEFENKEAFDFHQTRVKQSHWGEITVNVERHYVINE